MRRASTPVGGESAPWRIQPWRVTLVAVELVWWCLGARFRRTWVPSLVMALLIGVIGGFVFAAAAAARRVDDSYDVLMSEIDAPDLVVVPECGSSGLIGCTGPTSALDTEVVTGQISRLGAVERVRPVAEVRPYLIAPDGTPLLAEADNPKGCFDGDRSVSLLALRDGGPREQPLPFRLIGELPQGDPSGVVLTRATAERVGVGIGDGFTLAGWCTGDGDAVELSEPIDLVVTGVSIGAFDVEPPGTGQTIEPAYVDATLLDALYTAGADRSGFNTVWLRDGSTAEVTRQLDGYDVVLDVAKQTAIIDEALDADARPLWILAAFGALAGILLLAPIIDRSIRDDADDVATLVALGSTRSQVGLRAVSHIAVVAAAGALVAIASAPGIATLLPLGLAEVIVTERVYLDAVVTVFGTAFLISAVAAAAAFSTWRLVAGPRTSRPITALTTDRAVGSLRLRPPAQTGAMAAVGRPAGRRLASPWPGLVSLVLACTVSVAGLTYVGGLHNLEQSPHLLGWNWDVVVALETGPGDRASVIAKIGQLDGVEQATVGTLWPPVFLSTPGSDLQVWPWSFTTGPGAITPTMVQGRAPEGPDEVAIDLVFRDLTGLAPGDTVQLQRPSLAAQLADELGRNSDSGLVIDPPDDEPVVALFEITGIAVLSLERTQLVPQTSFTLAGLAAFVEPSVDEVEATRAWLPDDLPDEARDAVDQTLSDSRITDRVVYVRTSGDARDVAARIEEFEGVGGVMAPRPFEVVTLINALSLSGADDVPLALAILAAVAALALVTYLLSTGMWARRTELAILRALGLSAWGVRSSLAAQATTTVVLLFTVSVPVGVAIGRTAWLEYARDLLVVPAATVPWTRLVALFIGALVAVNVVAVLVAQLTVRRSAARELRAE